jgi:hypothetical protein
MWHVRGTRILAAGVLAIAAGLAVVVAPPASADDGVVVSVLSCANNGGSTSVPSGTPITVHHLGYAEGTRGLVQDFLLKQDTTLTVAGDTTTVYDVSGQWGDPQKIDRGFWLTDLPDQPIGLVLAAGQTVAITWNITFSQPVLVAYPPVGPTGDNGPDLLTQDGPATCLVTGS